MKKYLIVFLCAFMLMISGCSKEEEKISEMSGKQMLIVGMDCDNQPFAYETKEQSQDSVVLGEGYVKGFDVSLSRYLAKTLQREISIVNMEPSQMSEALEEGSIDVAISALTMKDDDQVDVSSPYYEEGYSMIVRKDSKLASAKSIQTFAKKKVIALKDSFATEAIKEIKDVTVLEALDKEALVKALLEKQCDGIIVANSIAKVIVKTNKDTTMVSFDKGQGFTTKNQYVIVLKEGIKEEEESLYHEIEAALQSLETETKNDWMKAN